MISKHTLGIAHDTRKLSDLVDFLDHKRKPVKESERVAGPYPYYGANGRQGFIDGFIFDEPLVLLAEDGGHFENPNRGIAYRIDGKSWVNNHAHVLRPKPSIDGNYLCRVLENYDVTPWITGTTRGKLTKAGASEIEIPLPTLPEQCRIAAILDKADALRAKRREAIAKLDQLLQSVFLEIFGDPVTNPKGWPTATLGDLAREKMSNGIFRKKESYSEAGLPVVWVEELFRGHELNLGASRTLMPTKKDITSYGLLPGDIVFCRSSLKLDGIAYNNVYLGRANEALFECHLIRLRVMEDVVDPVFLNYLLRNEGVREKIKSRAKTSTMTTIDQRGLGEVPVVIPTLKLQKKFRTALDACALHLECLNGQLLSTNKLFESLQQRALAGTL